MEPTSNEWNQALALSLKEKGKRCSLTASWFAFKVPLSLKKVEICRFGSSAGDPENWFCCTKLSSAGLILKLLPSTVGYTIIACGSTEEVKREYRSNKELFNLINFYWWLEEDSVVKIGFLTVEKRIIKGVLGLLVHLGDKLFTNQTLNLNFILDLLSKDKFLLSVSKFLSKSVSVFL